MIGAARRYERTGEDRSRAIATFFWNDVTGMRSYATGGTSNNEEWQGEPGQLAKAIGPMSQETCVTYNMLKLTRELFGWSPEAHYADFYERAYFNGILPTQHPADGEKAYYTPLAAGYWKLFGAPNAGFWCCHGTGVENFSKLADSVYFHDDDGIWVNLFVPSEVRWKEKGVRLIQDTRFPETDVTALTLRTEKPTRMTFRNNLSTSDSPNDGVGDQIIAVIESRSSSKSIDNQSLLSLRSSLSSSVSNELKLGFSLADRSLTPNTYIPRGFVRVRSKLPNGTTGDVRLQFGGNRLAPEASGERQYQLINTAYWQHGKQLVTMGVDNSLTYLRTFIPTDEGGLFEFDSLGAFDNLVSSRYTRQVPLGSPPYAHQNVLDLGAFAQTEWRPSPKLVATLGLRYDVTSFLTAAGRNELVEQKLGIRTDNTPTDWNGVQPRAQIVWDVRADGRDVVRLGAGAFTAQPHYYLQANNIFFDGLQLADLTQTGAAVPQPDYGSYRSSLEMVPGVPNGTSPPTYINLMGAAARTA